MTKDPSAEICDSEAFFLPLRRLQRLRENRAGVGYTNDDLITHIREAFFFPPRLLSADYISGGTLLEAFTSTLFLGQFSDNYPPPPPPPLNYTPRRNTSEDLLRRLLENINTPSFLGLRNYDVALTASHGTLSGRYVYETEEGFVGVASLEAKSGDEIYIAVGCNVLLVLRHLDGDEHMLVRGCYVLAPLPKPIRMIYGWDANKAYGQKFVDDETGAQSLADPRVKD